MRVDNIEYSMRSDYRFGLYCLCLCSDKSDIKATTDLQILSCYMRPLSAQTSQDSRAAFTSEARQRRSIHDH